MNPQKDISIIQCGRCVSQQEIELIRETVNLFPQLSRTELAKTISENLKWFTASGSNKTIRKAGIVRTLSASAKKRDKKAKKRMFYIFFC